MIDALYVAETGLNTYSTYLDVISNNIANISTPGFKKTGVNFNDLVYQDSQLKQAQTAGVDSYNQHQVGLGTSIGSTYKVFTDGQLVQTSNPMDIAISGTGFIEVEMADGTTAYTRAGRLTSDQNGYLATADGYKLSGNIQLPPDTEAMVITREGQILLKLSGESDPFDAGTLELVKFTNPEALNAVGFNVYTQTKESGQAYSSVPGESGTGTIIQGYQEVSNVSLTEEMVNMMTAQRAFQLNSRVVQVADQMLETINNMRR
jgi:flagellar basal-body rod protein FlgG